MRAYYLTIICCCLALLNVGLTPIGPLARADESAAVEGKRPKPKPRPRPDRDHVTPDPAPAPEPKPIPPKPRPEPDPNFIHVRPLPKPVIPVPDVAPVQPGFIRWLLAGAASLVKWLIVCVVVGCVTAIIVVLLRFNPLR